MDLAPRLLARRLLALPHPDVRREALRNTPGLLEAPMLAHWLGFLVLQRAHPDLRPLWLDTVLLLMTHPEGLGEGRAEEACRLLDTHPLRAVMGFLAVPPGERSAADGIPPRYALEEMPLGTRKWRARGQNRDLLRLLCLDPDPAVLRVLLGNPRVTEEEALRIASRRPQVAPAFLEVLASTRFGVREPVQAALALNPWCPVRISLAVLPLLSRSYLGDVMTSSGLDDRVRHAAGLLLDAALPGR